MSSASSNVTPGDSQRPQASQAQRTAEAKAAFTESLKNVGSNIESELQTRARNIHAMDKALTKQEKDLRQDTKKLAKQNEEMQKFLDKSNRQLAAFDDLDTLHSSLDADLEDLEEMLRGFEEEQNPESTHE